MKIYYWDKFNVSVISFFLEILKCPSLHNLILEQVSTFMHKPDASITTEESYLSVKVSPLHNLIENRPVSCDHLLDGNFRHLFKTVKDSMQLLKFNNCKDETK